MKKIKLVDDFPMSYLIDVDPDWPERNEEIRNFNAYQPLSMGSDSFVELRFYPREKESWIGRFEENQRSAYHSVVLSTPEMHTVCVIAPGAGYWVDVDTRTAMQLKCMPITSAIASVNQKLIIVSTCRDLIAFRSAEPVWICKDLADDDLQITAVDADHVVLKGYKNSGIVKIRVQVATGHVVDIE